MYSVLLIARVALAVVAVGAATSSVVPPKLSVSPRRLAVGGFSGTARLRIEGSVQHGSNPVVVVRGGDVTQRFDRKGRFGFIWMNSGTVEVSEVPALFLSFSRGPVAALLSRAAIDAAVLDERALVSRMRIRPRETDREEIRDAYLRLKLDEGSYRSFSSGLEIDASSDGRDRFSVDLPWPQAARAGAYRAAVYECRGGSIVGTSEASFEVEGTGTAAGMKHLADGHAWLYAALAVGVAMSLGFGLDFVLARVRRHRTGRRRRRAEAPARKDVGKDVAVH